MSTPANQAAMAGPSRTRQSAPTGLERYQEPNTPLFVAAAVVASTAVGASAGATFGLARSLNPYQASWNMGSRWFVASTTFFGSREYIITPLLTSLNATPLHEKMNYRLSQKQLGKLPALNLTRREQRTARMLDSGLAGGLLGLIGSWAIFGRGRAIRGGITGGLLASVLQLGVNSARLVKEDYFDPPPAPIILPVPAASTVQSNGPSQTSVGPVDGGTESRIATKESKDGMKESTSKFGNWISSTIYSLSPARRLTDAEQLEVQQLRRQRLDEALLKIEEEELKVYEKVQEVERKRASTTSS